MAKMRLRRFLYLDGDLTDEFLAQAEGGLYSEEDQSTTASSERGGTVGLSAGPAAAEVGAAKGGQESRARKVRQTEESGFSRLASLLESSGSVQWLDSFDDEIWEQLERGEVLEIECQLQLPQIVQFMQVRAAIEPMKELMELTGEKFDPEAVQGFGVLGLINQMLEGTPLIASALGSPDFRFIASLHDNWLRVAADELQGEAPALLLCRAQAQTRRAVQLHRHDAGASQPTQSERDGGRVA
ncbi:MAG TPA: hypothetical protein VHI77_00910 [Solirubrobacterales bacterium]|jgi:hypothetical protein|nr:hypothetical protein [Solirubrobacterales bacterium]